MANGSGIAENARHVLLKLLMRRDVLLAALVAAVSSAVLLAVRHVNPGQGAEHYFSSNGHHAAHRMMQICYVVILSAAAFNLRFVAFEGARITFSRFAK